MSINQTIPQFKSVLAPFIETFIQEKRACGYRYTAGAKGLWYLDRYLSECGLDSIQLPKVITKQWLAKRDYEARATQQQRIYLARQFARFLIRHGYPSYVPDSTLSVNKLSNFAPRILTHEEISRLLDAVKQVAPTAHSPVRHLIMPEVFHLLYGCGFRIQEVLGLRVRDVDLDRGILIVREGKFLKDRLVPPAPSLVVRLQKYEVVMGQRPADAFFFPSPTGGICSYQAVSHMFRKLLFQCDIPYGGRGKGPRLHDLRHTFAVHTLMRWYREGADLNAKLPLLATYMGHLHLRGTQRYLHLTAEFFPDILARVNRAFGDVIPGRVNS